VWFLLYQFSRTSQSATALMENLIQTDQEIWYGKVEISSSLQASNLWLSASILTNVTLATLYVFTKMCFRSSHLGCDALAKMSCYSLQKFLCCCYQLFPAQVQYVHASLQHTSHALCPGSLLELHHSPDRIILRHVLWDIFWIICEVTFLKANITVCLRSSKV
jgi:hypothetical protein